MRVAIAQKLLDAGDYRSMKLLGTRDEMDDHDEATAHPADGIYADLDNGLARLVEPVTNTVIWQHNFTVARATPADDDAMCGGWNEIGMSLWWDETSRVVLASQLFRTGGCMCRDDIVETRRARALDVVVNECRSRGDRDRITRWGTVNGSCCCAPVAARRRRKCRGTAR